MTLIVELILIGVVGFLLVVGAGRHFGIGPLKPKKSPEEEMQEVIDAATARMKTAQEAQQKSEVHVRQLERDYNSSEADVKRLTAQVESALGEGDEDKARKLIKRLQSEETERDDKKQELDEALANHQFYEEAIETERKAIISARKEAESLNVRLQLAEADRAFREADSTSDKLNEMRQRVRHAEITTHASRPPKDEFLEAAEEQEVEDRLAQFKKGL